MDVTVFTSADWSGEAAESDEIRPQWFPVTALPLDRMWDDGRHWLPRVLAGERLRAVFSYAPDNETVATSTITPAVVAGRAKPGHIHVSQSAAIRSASRSTSGPACAMDRLRSGSSSVSA